MSWLKVAIGLLREAAGTDAGREVIDNMRSRMRKGPESPDLQTPIVDLETVRLDLAAHRAEVEQNLDAVVQKLNSISFELKVMKRQQKIWNIVLCVGVLVALLVAIFI